jgi:hypothetical protein
MRIINMNGSFRGSFPLTRILLTQQRLTTLGEALEQAMKIEAMEGYPGSLHMMQPVEDNNIVQLQGHISTLTEKIQELALPKGGRPQVWCTGCYTKGHTVTKCPRSQGGGV